MKMAETKTSYNIVRKNIMHELSIKKESIPSYYKMTINRPKMVAFNFKPVPLPPDGGELIKMFIMTKHKHWQIFMIFLEYSNYCKKTRHQLLFHKNTKKYSSPHNCNLTASSFLNQNVLTSLTNNICEQLKRPLHAILLWLFAL